MRREVADLELESSQWLDLLKVRTKGAARQAVQRACDITLETSPAKACEIVWKFLDTAFETTKKPSQSLIAGIINGPLLTLTDLEGLTRFAQDCDSAQCLIESSPNTFLSLNEEMTQERIFDRLSPDMNREWFKYRLEKGHEDGPVSFKIFAKWINVQLKIELKRRGPDRNEKSYTSSLTAQNERQGAAPSQPNYPPLHQRMTSPVDTSPGQSRIRGFGCKVCGRKDHESAVDCSAFRKLTPDERHGTCTNSGPLGKGLCKHCLISGCTRFSSCPKKVRCMMCRYDHHVMMGCRSDNTRNSPGTNASRQ